MKCHKDDIDKVDLIQPCVTGEYDISIYLYIYIYLSIYIYIYIYLYISLR